MDDVFQHAYARVRSRHSDQGWFALSQREITTAIYAEIRALDRARFLATDAANSYPMAIAAE